MYASQRTETGKREPYTLAMDLAKIAREIGVEFSLSGFTGKKVSFRLLPDRSTTREDAETGKQVTRYQRRSGSPIGGDRKVHAVCWHGHYAFMRAAFDRLPGLRIQSAMADYRTPEDFDRDAVRSLERNIGSAMYPTMYGDACYCESDRIDTENEALDRANLAAR
jgi:hypothetical protein